MEIDLPITTKTKEKSNKISFHRFLFVCTEKSHCIIKILPPAAGNRRVEEIYKEDKYYKREYSYYRNNTVKSMVETGDSNISINYQYDEAGNISEKVEIKDGVEERYTYAYNEANRMVTETDINGVRRSYRYDLNGNRTQRVISNEEEAETEEKEVIDFFYYNYEDQLEEIVLHNGKVFTYGYDGEGNRLWRTHAQYPLVKPPVEEDERLEDPATFPGYNKDKSNNGNGNGKAQTVLLVILAKPMILRLDLCI